MIIMSRLGVLGALFRKIGGNVSGGVCLLALGVLLPLHASNAAEFAGAEAVLRGALAAAEIKPAEKASTPDAGALLLADIKAFQAGWARMEPAAAAKNWVALFDRYAQLDESARSGWSFGAFGAQPASRARPVQPQDLIAALPGPAAWVELTRVVEARAVANAAGGQGGQGKGKGRYQEIGLRVLVHTLTGDVARRREDFAALEALGARAKRNEVFFLRSILDNVWRADAAVLDDADALIRALERRLALRNPERSFGGSLEVPDLVGLVGAERAEAFLRRALVESEQPLRIEAGASTRALAAKLALELAGDLKKPQWSLVDSIDSVALYEALDGKFGEGAKAKKSGEAGAGGIVGVVGALVGARPVSAPGVDTYEKNEAKAWYLLGLIARGRKDDAARVAGDFAKEDEGNFSLPESAVREMERAGFTGQLNDFFRDLLKQNPELPFWRDYAQLAAHAGRTSEMVELVRSNIANDSVGKSQQLKLRSLLYRALLADDDVEGGVAELKQALNAAPEKSSGGGSRLSSEYSRGTLALNLARLGLLLNRADWLEEGIAIASREAQKETGQENFRDEWDEWNTVAFSNFLGKANRGAEQEAVLGAALGRAMLKSKNDANAGRSYGPYAARESTRILAALVRLYHKAGRYADVLYLLDNAPGWGVADLKDLGDNWDYGDHERAPLGYHAAAALARTGRANEARKMLDALFAAAPGCDRLYELLLEIDDNGGGGGDAVPAKLDALFARDQFEERPLIWKAHWLRKHNRLEEAEAAARKAISIDPTDGEQPAGDRLRAYAELAEIRAARGDQKEAASLRDTVAAVQEAERADELQSAGLLKQATAMYEHSLGRFADAYCIHARLAVQLSARGKYDEAAEHYRKAYELMPDQFGRVESYCFGCESAFDGPRAQGVAEKVFTQLAEKTPDKPQVHYLLAYLRLEQARYKEALAQYRVAVQLDPDYLNAWAKLNEVGKHVLLSAAERDEIAFNLLRLDPLQRHGSVPFESISNLAGLWKALEEARAKWPPREGPLYPLAASKAEIERRQAEEKANNKNRGVVTYESEEAYYGSSRRSNSPASPVDAIKRNRFLEIATSLMQRQLNDFGD